MAKEKVHPVAKKILDTRKEKAKTYEQVVYGGSDYYRTDPTKRRFGR